MSGFSLEKKMTKLQLLNQYLTERLMEAVREILEVVGDTVSEYQEETARAQRESESLRRRLREVVLVAEAPWSETPQPASIPVSGGRSPAEPEIGAQDWSPRLGRDLESTRTEDRHKAVQKEEEFGGAQAVCVVDSEPEDNEPGLKKLALEIALSVVSPSNASSDLNAIQTADNTAEVTRSSGSVDLDTHNPRPGQVKAEPREIDFKPEEPTEPSQTLETQDETSESLCEGNTVSNSDVTGVINTDECATQETRFVSNELSVDNYFVSYTGDKQHCCFHCGKLFSQVCNLKAHLQIHSGERPYSCNWCGKSFTQSADLRRHQRIHTGEKPHHCSWCEKSFTQIGNLKRHLRIHTGERPYCCTMCGKTFNDGDTLKKHKRIHTGERPFYCTYCSKTFTVASSLQNHLRNHMRENKQQI